MANKNGQKIIISLIVGITAACITLNNFSKMQKTIKEKEQLIEVMQLNEKQIKKTGYTYFTFIHDMNAGETVKENDIMLTAFKNEQEDGITEKEDVVGNVLLENVKNGQIITNYVFTGVVSDKSSAAKGLKEGYRALTLSTSALDGMSNEMKTGTYIDIFSKSTNSNIVLSKVKILSLEPAEQKNDATQEKSVSITGAKTVTFEVPVNKIQELVEIYSAGKLLLVMRPAGDDTVITGNKKTVKTKKYTSNYSYNPDLLTPLPNIEPYEEPLAKELPAPVKPKNNNRTVEVIEANNKTQVNFD